MAHDPSFDWASPQSVTMNARSCRDEDQSVDPSATVIPVLSYPDVRAAVVWLAAAFGFVERVRIGEGRRSDGDRQ